MHLKPDINYMDFFQAISLCRSDVLLKTVQGDVINLNSELSKFIFAVLSKDKEKLADSSVECASEQDLELLSPFLIS